MQQDYKTFLQRQVAIAVGTASLLLAIIGFLRRTIYFGDSFFGALIDPDVGGVLIVGFIFLGATIRRGAVTRAIQVAVGFLVACVSAITAESGDLSSSVFLVAAMMLASEYDVIGRRPILLIGLPLALYVACFFFGIYSDTGAVLASFHTLIGAGIVAYLFVAIIRTRLAQVRDREDELETKVAQRTEGLRREVKRRAKLESDLRQSADESQRLASERALLLHELHHRTKNDLQLIASMIRLHGDDEGASSSQDMMAAAEDRIMAIALVHEHLYSSEELAAISLSEYIEGLAAHMRSANSGSRISIIEDIQCDLRVGIEPAIHLGLTINELVQNARKHGFPNGRQGTVRISTTQTNETLTLIVQDDGVGFRPEDVDPKGVSVGIEIVRGLVAQLEGEAEVSDSGMTAWKMTFPVRALTPRGPIVRADSDSPCGYT